MVFVHTANGLVTLLGTYDGEEKATDLFTYFL